ncbi:MAG TPA: SecY family transport protein, partial [Desulfobaccales bacterium]|nr:SecY family transport protein [Desulfobaccales bacterium]
EGTVVMHPGWEFRIITIITLTSGTAFIMWLGEMITERGIGNGISLIIFAGIVARMPSAILSSFTLMETGEIMPILMAILIVVMVVVVGFIVFFCYFYTAVTFNPVDVADNLKKWGGYVPGLRPGKPTSDYIDRILTRITLWGAVYVSAVCVLPTLLIRKFNVPFYFGGTALLIVVGVAMDTMSQIESHLLTRHYEGFMKKRMSRVRR